MNLLAHLYLADLTGTSMAGQILGDRIKGRLDGRFAPNVEQGIRLHRAIDGFTDRHPATAALRRRFAPPLRRYGGILVDIGFDCCLARNWARHCVTELPRFAAHAVTRVAREWPAAETMPTRLVTDLPRVLVDYRHPHGLQRALDSVDRRLARPSPLPTALPALLDQYEAMAEAFATFFPELCEYASQHVRSQ